MIRPTLAILLLAGATLATPLEAQTSTTATPTEEGYWQTTWIRFGLETHRGNSDSTFFTGDMDWNTNIGLLESRFDFDSSWAKTDRRKFVEQQKLEWTLRRLFRPHSRWFYLIHSWADHHELSGIDLRTAIGPGVGVHLIDTKKMRFTMEGGPQWVREKHNNGRRESFGALFFNPTLTWHITDHIDLDHDMMFRKNLTEGGDFFIYSETDVDYRLTKVWFLSTCLIINYDADPVRGHKRMDIETKTAIKIKFGTASR